MRVIAESGGLAWGDMDDELDAVPLAGKLGGIDKPTGVLRVALYPRGVPDQELPPWADHRLRVRARRPTIMLFDGNSRSFRLRWPRERSPLEALERICAIERRSGSPPPAWAVTALYFAGRAMMAGVEEDWRVGGSANAAVVIAQSLKSGQPLPGNPSDEQIREIARQMLTAKKGEPPIAPSDPWATARLVWQMGELAWSSEMAEAIVRFYDAQEDLWSAAMSVALSWALLHQPRLIEPLEGGWRYKPEIGLVIMRFWLQRLVLREAVLAEAQALYVPWQVRETWRVAIDPPKALPDAGLALAYARRLIAEGEAGRRYSEHGIYDAELPPALPLATWGVKRLRWVCLRTGYWWVSLLDEAGESIGAFRWRGAQTSLNEMSLVIPNWMAPYVHLAVAALWHDLVVAGEDVFVPVGRGRGGGEHKAREAAAHAERVLRLPRARRIPLGEVWPQEIEARAWGGDEDRRTLEARRRAMHAVRGHYRRLAEGWRAHEAGVRAESYGMPPPPEGYTFVAPHVRGGERRGADEATLAVARRRVQARGLEALVAALG